MPQDYNILNRLVHINLRDSSYMWGREELSNYYNLEKIIWDTSVDLNTYDLPLIEDNMYHTIKGNERYLLIILK